MRRSSSTDKPNRAESHRIQITPNPIPNLSIAPMMKYTDKHYRYCMRAMTKHTQLYTEMVCASTILRGNYERALALHEVEHPVVLQLGGDDPQMLYDAIQIAESFNYDEYNLNVGCPSEKVQSGNFGVCLMDDPKRVCMILERMQDATSKAVTIKHRIGIMNKGQSKDRSRNSKGTNPNQYRDLHAFVDCIRQSGVKRFIVHARIAILGLKPKENRNIPPLCYHDVYRLQEDFPDLSIEINGGIKTLSEAKEHSKYTAGAMIGRAAWDNPYIFAHADSTFHNNTHQNTHKTTEIPSRSSIVKAMIDYLNLEQNQGVSRRYILRHLVHLFAHYPGSAPWRQLISANPSDAMLMETALELEHAMSNKNIALLQIAHTF